MTVETNPESGSTAYTYDNDSTCGTSNGDLVKRVDALNNVTCYHYDALHRVTSITYPSGPYASVTPSKYFVYDAASISFNGTTLMSNAKNRLAEAYTCTSCPGTKITDLAFSYSVRGEMADVYESTPHSGGWYHVNGTYWANGALNQLSGNILPATFTYNTDGEGRVSSVNASAGTNPATVVAYNTASQVTDMTLGNGDSDHYTFDPSTGRMTQYKFTVGFSPQNVIGNLTWNADGSLGSLAITDPFNSANNQSCAYANDDLGRIASANCGLVWSQAIGFDPFGNVAKSGSYTFLPTYSTSTNRILTISGAPNPTYDANGNLLTITDATNHIYAWDAEGRQIGIDSVGATYDAFGRAVELNNSGAYTQIVYGLGSEKLALLSGQTLQKAFIGTPTASAVYNSSGLSYFRHSDWLGSSRFASNAATRTMYSSTAYAPYGEPYSEAGSPDRSFTAQDQDTVGGLYDFLFRRDNPVQGRWISPDPAGLAAVDRTSPQTWSRYAYTGNSPNIAVDAQGLLVSACMQDDSTACGIQGGWGGGAPAGCSMCGGYTRMQEFWRQTFALLAASGKDGVELYFLLPGARRYDQLSGLNWILLEGDYMDYPYIDPRTGNYIPPPNPLFATTVPPGQLLPTLPWNGKLGGTAPKTHGAKQ
jgi:RHS repeat-associated protein